MNNQVRMTFAFGSGEDALAFAQRCKEATIKLGFKTPQDEPNLQKFIRQALADLCDKTLGKQK